MKFSLICLTILLLISGVTYSQPGAIWVSIFSEPESWQEFLDIYALPDGGFVMCGRSYGFGLSQLSDMYVVRIDAEGEEIWANLFHVDSTALWPKSIIEVDGGGYLVGGTSCPWRQRGSVTAWRIDEEGNQIWSRTYSPGTCSAIIELKGGDYLLAGYNYDNHQTVVICINGEGQLLWQEIYQNGRYPRFDSMRETEGGVIIVGCGGNLTWFVKIDHENEGELLWSCTREFGFRSRAKSIVRGNDDGFVIAGKVEEWEGTYSALLFKIDDEGNVEWDRRYEQDAEYSTTSCVERYNNGTYALVGGYGGQSAQSNRTAVIRSTNNIGGLRWIRELDQFDEFDFQTFYSVARGADGSIVAAGRGFDQEYDAVVVKMIAEIPGIDLLYWSPPDTILSCLPGDSITFVVRAESRMEDDPTYLWIMGDDTLSRDTTTTVLFEELGEYEVQCQVSDGILTIGITWHISVVEWYIDLLQPDSTEIAIRRGSWIDFTHQTRAIDEREFDYRWEHFGRGGNFEIDGEDSVRYIFNGSSD